MKKLIVVVLFALITIGIVNAETVDGVEREVSRGSTTFHNTMYHEVYVFIQRRFADNTTQDYAVKLGSKGTFSSSVTLSTTYSSGGQFLSCTWNFTVYLMFTVVDVNDFYPSSSMPGDVLPPTGYYH